MSFRPRRKKFLLATASLTISILLSTSCSSPERGGANFCGELSKKLEGLTGPLSVTDDIGDVLSRYISLDKISPLAIEEQWHTVTLLVKQAADVDPEDPLSRQELADAAYQAERPAREIAEWVRSTCGFTMPNVIGVEGSIAPVTTFAP